MCSRNIGKMNIFLFVFTASGCDSFGVIFVDLGVQKENSCVLSSFITHLYLWNDLYSTTVWFLSDLVSNWFRLSLWFRSGFYYYKSSFDLISIWFLSDLFSIIVLCPPFLSITGSAVCAFYMDDIEKAFAGKFKEQRNSETAWTPVPEDQVPKPRWG